MTVSQMRNKLIDIYSAPKWRDRVDSMPDNQVIAVYYSFLERKKFQPKKKKKEEYHQITLDEYFGGVAK